MVTSGTGWSWMEESNQEGTYPYWIVEKWKEEEEKAAPQQTM